MAQVTVYVTKDATALDILSVSNGGYWSSGEEEHICTGLTGAGAAVARSFVYFPINFSGMLGINSATLYVRSSNMGAHSALSGSVDIYASRATKDWGEGGNRGENVYSANDSWNWDGATKGRYDAFTTSGQATTSVTNTNNYFSWGVTSIVTAWFNGSANYGIMLRSSNEGSSNKGHEFYDRSKGSAYRAYLVIDYSTNTAPNAPTSLSPTGSATVNTLAPTYSGTRSDPDAGDSITAYQIIVYKDDGTTQVWDSGSVNGSGTSFSRTHGNGGTIYSSLIGNTFYKWKGRTWDSEGLVGPYSALQRFKVNTTPSAPSVSVVDQPILDLTTLTPRIQVTHTDPDPTDTLMHAYTVLIELANGTSVWNSGDIDTSGAPVNSVQVTAPTLSWQTAYRVRARTKDANGAWSPYKAPVYFTTHTTAAPVNLAPNNATISGLVPTFEGGRGHASDNITSYRIQLYQSDAITLVWDSGTLTSGISGGTAFSTNYPGSPALSYGTTYKWRSLVTSSIGGTGAYSAFQTFDTPADANVPTQTAPVTSPVTSLTPTFTGARASSAFNAHQIQVYPSTATQANLGTPHFDNGTEAQASGTTYSWLYDGTALSWATTYKWRVRVSSDGGSAWSNWTGLAQFTTDSAGTAVLTSPISTSNFWQTTVTPSLAIARAGSDTIDQMQVRLYNATGSVLIWDSGMTNVADGTTASLTYSGDALTPGTTYSWQSAYKKTTGPTGAFSSLASFRVNGAPSIPTQLSPIPGYAFPDTLLPVFGATFSDPDTVVMGDYPTSWNIEVRNNATDALIQLKTITTGLINGANSYTWQGGDTALAYGVVYKWRTRYTDSKSAVGTWSAYQTFKLGQSPNGTIISVSSNTARPVVGWTYNSPTSTPQYGYKMELIRDDTDVTVYTTNAIGAGTSYTFPAGYVFDNKDYIARLTVKDENLMDDVTPYEFAFLVDLDAPDAIQGLSPTNEEEWSRITLTWDNPGSLKAGHTFVRYNIYRKRVTDVDYELVGTTSPQSNTTYRDWYAGQSINYHYRVTITTRTATSGIELESSDDPGFGNIATAALDSDVWMFIGADRADDHVLELPVSDEDHEGTIQQESFEVLGADRKVIIRGFVLGDEGSISCVWTSTLVPSFEDPQVLVEETVLGRRLVDYLTNNKGPHTLKSPFGDVWDVDFEGPKFKWITGGHLQVSLSWVETGQTGRENS